MVTDAVGIAALQQRPIFHLSFPVASLQASLAFYRDCLGASIGRRSDAWVDVILFGHQLTLHQQPDQVLPRAQRGVRHFGAILPWHTLHALHARVTRCDAADVAGGGGAAPVELAIRQPGTPFEHAKLLLEDPDGNLIELKAYRDVGTIAAVLAGHDGDAAARPAVASEDCPPCAVSVRVAVIDDTEALMRVRMSVRENVLSSPSRITAADYVDNLCTHGRGWVAEVDGVVVGFASGRHSDGNIWALFVDPSFEGRGIGRRLHDTMVEWLFDRGLPQLWLTTGCDTRAERLYRRLGWRAEPPHPPGERRYVLDAPAASVPKR